MESLTSGQSVLLLWHGTSEMEKIKPEVERLTSIGVLVSVENAERLLLSNHPASKFDAAHSSVGAGSEHADKVLAEVARVLKPKGRFTLREPCPSPSRPSPDSLVGALKVAGFVDAAVSGVDSGVVAVEARKPDFEVGSAAALSLGLRKTRKNQEPAKKAVWTLEAGDMADEDVDLVDPDSLIEESDYVKPDPLSLKYDCGSDKSGRKKACKNCVCGLAEELEAGKLVTTRSPASACGSCYLGDAFRCASCPYLGMPAFKPGEKIQLTDRQLKGDV